jgi:toxin ParE1/3/4
VARIIFSKIARFDLKEIIEYIKRDSIKYALLEKKKIIEAIEKLETQPYLGRVVPELGNSEIRELIFRNYRIVYQTVSKGQIDILSIHHHSRLLSNNPAFKDND